MRKQRLRARKPAAGGAPSSSKIDPDEDRYLSRIEAAQLANVAVNTIINWERRELLRPRRVMRSDARGAERAYVVYGVDEVAKLARRGRVAIPREPGETAARCFELLREGATVNDIVIQLRETPTAIELLREAWLDGGAANLVINASAKKTLERYLGAFESVADLVERVIEQCAKGASAKRPPSRKP